MRVSFSMQLAINHSPFTIIGRKENHLYLSDSGEWRMVNGQCGMPAISHATTNNKRKMKRLEISARLFIMLQLPVGFTSERSGLAGILKFSGESGWRG